MHMIDTSNNRANIAFIGQVPWHGLGVDMPEGADMDEWREAAGLGWHVERTPALFKDLQGNVQETGQHVLFRNDTGFPLSVVSERYNPVQPEEIFEFYRSLTDSYGFSMETAGSLDNGKRIWCLANVGQEFSLKGQDVVKNYLLLATSYDKTMATRAQFTSVRVVCNNTLSLAANSREQFVSVSHSTKFDPDKMKVDLGITAKQEFSEFADRAEELTERKVTQKEAVRFLTDIMAGKNVSPEDLSTRKANQIKEVFSKFNGGGKGAHLRSSEGTAWGLVNALTEYVDHDQGRTPNTRMRSAWFGQGNNMKSEAFNHALELVA